jgi:outer membrane protein assembly factor BamB
MSRRLALVLAPLLLGMAGPWLHAQSTSPQDLVPKRTSLARLGLERHWLVVVPLAGSEQVLKISRSADLFFVQTSHAMLHVYDAETGGHRWSAQLGEQISFARPVSSNSYAVFASCANMLHALDRNTGRPIWRADLGTIPTSGTACDDNHLIVGLNTGMINCYQLKQQQEKGPDKIQEKPVLAWNLRTGGEVRTLPLIGENICCLGSNDGRVFVNLTNEPTPLYRVKTGGAIGDELGTVGTRMLLVPSADYNLYAVDVLTTKMLWVFPSGAPIEQVPMVADDEIFVINKVGSLSSLDPKSGVPRWTTGAHSARLLGVSRSKVYLRSADNDLLVVDRANGQIVADPAATFQRAGLNLRELDLSFTNRYDDRLYVGSSSGVIVSLSEIGQTEPVRLRDAKVERFGHVPPEGVKEKPAPEPTAAEPGAEPKADAGAEPKDEPAPKPQ